VPTFTTSHAMTLNGSTHIFHVKMKMAAMPHIHQGIQMA